MFVVQCDKFYGRMEPGVLWEHEGGGVTLPEETWEGFTKEGAFRLCLQGLQN